MSSWSGGRDGFTGDVLFVCHGHFHKGQLSAREQLSAKDGGVEEPESNLQINVQIC